VSKKCNLDCTYCYESKEQGKNMEISLALKSIKELTGFCDELVVIIHGGEPLMAGKKFFREVLAEGNRTREKCHIEYHLQTNGTLIDREWINIFRENRFSVSISMDGDQSVHDKHRFTLNGKGSFSIINKKLKLLEDAGLDHNCLCVITRESLPRVNSIVDFFKIKSFQSIDLLPCITLKNNAGARANHMTITPDEYASFIINFYDVWKDANANYTIRTISDFINIVNGQGSQTCIMRYPKVCGLNVIAIDVNGDVYPCDLFIGNETLRLGTIANEGLSDIFSNPTYRAFIETGNSLPEGCRACSYLKYCYGGCVHHRYMNGKDMKNKSFYCESYKQIINHLEKSN
jgi:uncharacterized protein